nr:immunoglobulin heavy chain junction region [Mus musculus]
CATPLPHYDYDRGFAYW